MNVQEKVATLEALLARVKKNAVLPRAVHAYEGGAAFPAIAAEGELAPVAPDLAVLTTSPVIADRQDAIADAQPMLVETDDVIADAQPMLVETDDVIADDELVVAEAKPVVAAAKEARAERPPRLEAEVPAERPRLVALAPPIGMAAPANKMATPDKGAAGPLERPVEAAKPPPRPPAPAPRPPKPPEIAPAAKVEPAAKPAERVPPPVPKVEPPPIPARPARPAPKVEPAIFAANPADRSAETTAVGMSFDGTPEKTEPIAAPPRHEQRNAPGMVWPSTHDARSTGAAAASDEVTRLQTPTDKLLGRTLPKARSADDDEISAAETRLMVGPIPDEAVPPLGEEATVVEEAPLAALLARSDDVPPAQAVTAGPLPKLHEPDESDAETQLIPSSRRMASPVTATQRSAEPLPVARADEDAVFGVPGPAVAPPPPVLPVAVPDRPAPAPVHVPEPVAAKASEPAIEPPRPVPIEVHAQPPRPVQTPQPVPAPRAENRRTAILTLGLAAAVLLGATVFVGYRGGWFSKIGQPRPTATPSVIRLPPVSPRSSGTALAPSGTTSASPGSTSEGSAKVPISPTGSGAATSPTAVDTASASPTTSAGTAPTAPTNPSAVPSTSATAPAPQADGTNLPANHGYLRVTSAVPASVYANGVYVGLTGQNIEVECGPKYIRLGTLAAPGAPPPKPPLITWLSEGRSSTVACKTVTNIPLDARAQ